MASSWTQAKSTWLTRRCRSKLLRLYSNSQRTTGMSTRRLRKTIAEAAAPPRCDW
jgi:hypothetical protein